MSTKPLPTLLDTIIAEPKPKAPKVCLAGAMATVWKQEAKNLFVSHNGPP